MGVETYVSKGKYGWRLRTSAGIEYSRAATFATTQLALDNAKADTLAQMASLGIVAPTPPPPPPPPPVVIPPVVTPPPVTTVQLTPSAGPMAGSLTVAWAPAIAGHIERNGVDVNGLAPNWGTDVAVNVGSWRFDNLAATDYTIKFTPKDGSPVVSVVGHPLIATPASGPATLDSLCLPGGRDWNGTSGRADAIRKWERDMHHGKPMGVVVEHAAMDLAGMANPFFLWYYAGMGSGVKQGPWRLSVTTCGFPWGGSFTAALRGDFDATWRAQCQNIVNYGFPDAILRPFHEMNCCYPWDATNNPTGYKDTFRRYVNIARSVGGQHFLFDWCPLFGGGLPDPMYPGDDVVDIIGLDVYPPSKDWNNVVNNRCGLQWQVNFANAHGKLMSLPESGPNFHFANGVQDSGCGDWPEFYDLRKAWVASHPGYLYVTDYMDDNAEYQSDIRNGKFPKSLAKYPQVVGV